MRGIESGLALLYPSVRMDDDKTHLRWQKIVVFVTFLSDPEKRTRGYHSCVDSYFTENQYITLNKRLFAPLPMLTAD